MTKEEKIICKDFLNDADKTHSCNEYKLLMALLEKDSTTKNDLGVDCISRAEMLRYQKYLHGKMSNNENYKLWEFIKALPSVTPQEPRWIPVSERLPEVGHRVIFSMKNDEIYIGTLHTLNNDLKITLERTGIGYVYSFENVVAWMPLPQPYKAESEEYNGTV